MKIRYCCLPTGGESSGCAPSGGGPSGPFKSSATCTYTWYKSRWWIATHSLQTTWLVSRCSLSPWLCRVRGVASFANKIQSEYYFENRSVSIEGIALEHFSAAPQADINSTSPSRPRHVVFHSFYLMIANRMLPLLLHTANVCYHFSRTNKY